MRRTTGIMLRTITAVLAVASTPLLAGQQAKAGAPLPYGLEAMERSDLLPYLPANGTQTKQFITYDTSARNNSSALNFKRYEENGEWVFFDEFGPGCLYRQQMNVFFTAYTQFPNEKAHIRLYFDDEPKPRIDMTFAEFFGKDGKYCAPFTPPLAYFDAQGAVLPFTGRKDKLNRLYAILY